MIKRFCNIGPKLHLTSITIASHTLTFHHRHTHTHTRQEASRLPNCATVIRMSYIEVEREGGVIVMVVGETEVRQWAKGAEVR